MERDLIRVEELKSEPANVNDNNSGNVEVIGRLD